MTFHRYEGVRELGDEAEQVPIDGTAVGKCSGSSQHGNTFTNPICWCLSSPHESHLGLMGRREGGDGRGGGELINKREGERD